MKLGDVLENYYFHSEKVSDISRQLGLAGIAFVWILKYDVNGVTRIPEPLQWPLILIVLGLAFDLFHYLIAAIVWSRYHRMLEHQGVSLDQDFVAPSYLNWPSLFFFYSKILLIAAAYILLLLHLAKTLV